MLFDKLSEVKNSYLECNQSESEYENYDGNGLNIYIGDCGEISQNHLIITEVVSSGKIVFVSSITAVRFPSDPQFTIIDNSFTCREIPTEYINDKTLFYQTVEHMCARSHNYNIKGDIVISLEEGNGGKTSVIKGPIFSDVSPTTVTALGVITENVDYSSRNNFS